MRAATSASTSLVFIGVGEMVGHDGAEADSWRWKLNKKFMKA